MLRERIKTLCKDKGIRQIDLANALEMREDSLSIALKKQTLSISKLEIIANILGVEIGDLFKQSIIFKCPCCGAELQLVEKKKEE